MEGLGTQVNYVTRPILVPLELELELLIELELELLLELGRKLKLSINF